eukprot:gene4947-5595_t
MSDKYFTEREVLKNEFPSAELQICLFHVLRSIRREVTTDKMCITSQQQSLWRSSKKWFMPEQKTNVDEYDEKGNVPADDSTNNLPDVEDGLISENSNDGKTDILDTVIDSESEKMIKDDINLIKFPLTLQKRGRPKGADLTVIGLPAKKKRNASGRLKNFVAPPSKNASQSKKAAHKCTWDISETYVLVNTWKEGFVELESHKSPAAWRRILADVNKKGPGDKTLEQVKKAKKFERSIQGGQGKE